MRPVRNHSKWFVDIGCGPLHKCVDGGNVVESPIRSKKCSGCSVPIPPQVRLKAAVWLSFRRLRRSR